MPSKSALRQDPDVILVGEMRDLETIETALTAAETGHLVMSTLHTLDATETINRIISVFPPYHQRQIRMQLSAVIKGVISQRLVARADGKGRVPAVEVMIGTARIRECIDDKEKTKQIHDAIAQGVTSYGMQTFDQSLMQLYTKKLITYEEALRQSSNPDDFALKISGHLLHLRPQLGPVRAGRTGEGTEKIPIDKVPMDETTAAFGSALNAPLPARPQRGGAAAKACDKGILRRTDRRGCRPAQGCGYLDDRRFAAALRGCAIRNGRGYGVRLRWTWRRRGMPGYHRGSPRHAWRRV